MSQSAGSPSPVDDLQFNTVEPPVGTAKEAGPAADSLACVFCRQPLTDAYYAVTDKVACPSCFGQVSAMENNDSAARFAAGAALGLGAGLLGALAWFAIRRLLQLEISIVAVLVGYMVARGIRKGSDSLGGLKYQILAVLITYLCIAANYAPDNFAYVRDQAHDDERTITIGETIFETVRDSLAEPFARGTANLIGILIIGFGLYQAWRMTARTRLPISGPYQVGAGSQIGVNQGVEVALAPQPIGDPTPGPGGKT